MIRTSALFLLFLATSFATLAPAHGQTPSPAPAQPLNASVSDIGTSFAFTPAPVCAACFETELGFLSLEDGRYLPGVVTLAAPRGHMDASVLVNLLDSEAPHSRRATHFGNRFDFILRQQVWSRGGFELTAAPHGAVFVRGDEVGRAGLALAPQYAWGRNLVIANFAWTGAIGVSSSNPRSDYLTAIDDYRTLQARGTAIFAGLQQEQSAGQDTVSIEQGLVLPFRNGQVELATEQLDLNTDPQVQVQARVIVNWGKLVGRR